MSRLSSFIFFATILLALMLLATMPALGSGAGRGLSQTWPSRTPTPSGPPPSPPPTEPPPQETVVATPQPGTTPLATQPPSTPPGAGLPTGAPSTGGSEGLVQPSLEGLQLPSAAEIGECGLPPIIVAQGLVNVRSGPGIEFETIAKMAFQEERVIVGRAADAAWWQILLSAEQLGWVSDQAVTVVGYTGAVPITFEGQVEQDQPLWNPTPNPACTPPSPEEISISNEQVATVVLVEQPPAESSRAPTPQADDELNDQDASTGFSALRPDESAAGISLLWLPIVGGFLIVAGGIALLIQRRQG